MVGTRIQEHAVVVQSQRADHQEQGSGREIECVSVGKKFNRTESANGR